MIIGGYKKDSSSSITEKEFVYIKELSIVCSYEELVRISAFFNKAVNQLEGYNYPYGECTLQFRDEDNSWMPGEHDIALVITGN